MNLIQTFNVEGKTIPTELKAHASELRRDLTHDEAQAEPTTHMDDEYAYAGAKDPKILITTSRDPSSRLQQFAKVCPYLCIWDC